MRLAEYRDSAHGASTRKQGNRAINERKDTSDKKSGAEADLIRNPVDTAGVPRAPDADSSAAPGTDRPPKEEEPIDISTADDVDIDESNENQDDASQPSKD